MLLGCVCFWWIFTLFRMFGCNGKYNFPEVAFLLTKIYPFDPEMNLHSHFHFNSFPSHSPRTATQREREKRNTKQTHTQRERELRSLTLPPRPPIQTPRPPIHKPRPPIHKTRAPSPKRNCPKLTRTHCSDLPRAGDAEFSQTITAQTNARSSSTSRSSVQPLRSPSQTLYHGEFSVTGSPSTHSPHLWPTHVRSTHSPHRSDLCIYI